MGVRRFEVYADSVRSADVVWAKVANPRRWPDWGDAEEIRAVEPEPLVEGGCVRARDGSTERTWRVVTFSPAERVLEVVAKLPRARLGIGARVRPLERGCRVVLACVYSTDDWRASLGYRLGGRAALRARFDRWATNLAGGS